MPTKSIGKRLSHAADARATQPARGTREQMRTGERVRVIVHHHGGERGDHAGRVIGELRKSGAVDVSRIPVRGPAKTVLELAGSELPPEIRDLPFVSVSGPTPSARVIVHYQDGMDGAHAARVVEELRALGAGDAPNIPVRGPARTVLDLSASELPRTLRELPFVSVLSPSELGIKVATSGARPE